MRILVYGAGVIGTLYAAKLKLAGHDVTVLARNPRLAAIRADGLIIENILTFARSITAVDTTEISAGAYDLALITVRRDQLAQIIPDLLAAPNIATILLMLNNPLGAGPVDDRFIAGFPGAGGTLEANVVRYALIPQQPTTVGEPGGRESPRLHTIVQTLRSAGFKTHISRNMDGWLKSHAFFITAIAAALYRAGADTRQLARDDSTLRLMCEGIAEGFRAVRSLDRVVEPLPLKILFTWMPRAYAVRYWRRYFETDMGDYVFARHVRASSDEMRALAADCRVLLRQAAIPAPALAELYGAIDSYRK